MRYRDTQTQDVRWLSIQTTGVSLLSLTLYPHCLFVISPLHPHISVLVLTLSCPVGEKISLSDQRVRGKAEEPFDSDSDASELSASRSDPRLSCEQLITIPQTRDS